VTIFEWIVLFFLIKQASKTLSHETDENLDLYYEMEWSGVDIKKWDSRTAFPLR